MNNVIDKRISLWGTVFAVTLLLIGLPLFVHGQSFPGEDNQADAESFGDDGLIAPGENSRSSSFPGEDAEINAINNNSQGLADTDAAGNQTQTPVDTSTAGNVRQPTGSGGSSGGGSGLQNPLKFSNLTDFFKAIIDIILIFAVPIIVFFIIYSGFLYVTAGGSEEKISKATATFMWAVVGGLIILGAWGILTIVQNTINAIT